MSADEPHFVSFEAAFEPSPPGTPATPRPPGRLREGVSGSEQEGCLVSPAPVAADAAFAREIAERVLEYARNNPGALPPEELAALVRHFVTHRPK